MSKINSSSQASQQHLHRITGNSDSKERHITMDKKSGAVKFRNKIFAILNFSGNKTAKDILGKCGFSSKRGFFSTIKATPEKQVQIKNIFLSKALIHQAQIHVLKPTDRAPGA